VTAGHCAAPVSTRACRPWQVAGPGGANPPAGAPSTACHWPPEWRTSPTMPSAPLRGLAAQHVPTYLNRPPRALISRSTPSLARMRACPSRRRPPLPPLGEHLLQSISSRTHEPQPFPVNHNTSPSHVLIKLSHPFAGVRASAAAAGPQPSSSLLRRFSKPRDLPGTFPGSHGSSPCSTWLSPGPSLTAVELPAGAPPPLAGVPTGRSTAANR
jgi:hypothetical protein